MPKESPSQVEIAAKKLRQKLGDEIVDGLIELIKAVVEDGTEAAE